MESTLVEQRRDIRSDLSWPVSVWLPEANRFFNGRSKNVSRGGAYLTLPMTTPIRPGQEVEINFPRTVTLARQKGQYARIKCAKVVRIDRKGMIEGACIGMAIQFCEKDCE